MFRMSQLGGNFMMLDLAVISLLWDQEYRQQKKIRLYQNLKLQKAQSIEWKGTLQNERKCVHVKNDISPKSCKWPTSSWKDAQHH